MEKLNTLLQQVKTAVKGKDDIIEKIIVTIMAGGHILMEDIPGVGKTTIALAMSKATDLDYKRVQFTTDTLPSDITGFSMYNKASNKFEYVEGAVVTNIFLADEINRTSPKTQSALLEAMEEKKVTVDSVTRKLPEPFVVIATQNPMGSAGTQRLPQSQIERFMTRLSMGYPDEMSEIEILKNSIGNVIDRIKPVLNSEDINNIKEQVENCFVDDSIYKLIVDIANETRNTNLLITGISPRGSVAMLKMAKANAVYNNRDYVIPEDILDIIYTTCCHRIELSNEALAKGYTEKKVIKELLKNVKVQKK